MTTYVSGGYGAVVSGGDISGNVIVNGVSSADLTHEQIIDGVSVRYSDAVDGERQVSVGGSIFTSVGPNVDSTSQVNSLVVRSQNGHLFVGRHEVDFVHGEDPRVAAVAAEARAKALAAVMARYPGVRFTGELRPGQIEPGVRIAPGAALNLRSGVQVRGNANIGPHANISGGVITGGSVDGDVDGGVLNGANVEAGGHVSGGILNGATVPPGADVSGGILNGTVLQPGEKVSGGIR